MIIEETDDYAVIVPDYLLESENEETETDTAPVDYSSALSDIVINQESTNDLLETVIENQTLIISSQEKLYSGISGVATMLFWFLAVSVGLFFARFFMSFFKS